MHTRTGKRALYSISYHGERVSLLEGLGLQKGAVLKQVAINFKYKYIKSCGFENIFV